MTDVPVFQDGTMVPYHVPRFNSNGLIQDAGGVLGDAVSGRGLSPFAITDDGTTGLAINSAVSSGAYNAFTLGHDSSGNALITVDSYGGLADKTVYLRKNGTLYEFPFSLTGIVGPVSTTVGHVATWNNTSGSLLADPLSSTATLLTNRSGNYSSSANYGGTSAASGLIEVLGSSGTPDSSQDAVAIFQKWSNSTTNYSAINPAVYVSNIMQSGADTARGTAFYAEGQLNVAAVTINNFVEGVRAHGVIANGIAGGSAYGLVAAAGEGVGASHYGYLIGIEGEVDNNSADATYSWGTGNSTNAHFESAFNATSRGSKKPFAAYIVNPFTAAGAAFQVGFMVPVASPNVASAPVIGAAFRSDAPSTWGLDVTGHGGGPTFGAVGIPNNVPIRGTRADLGSNPHLISIDASNNGLLFSDTDIAAIVLGPGTVTTLQLGSAAMAAANGSVATVLGNVGPAGSNTTVQEWAKIKFPSGNFRYMPGF